MAKLIYSILPLFLWLCACSQSSSEQNTMSETASMEGMASLDTTDLAKATFSGGCFWCTEAYFERVKGVEAVVSGYSGGTSANPTYKKVSAGKTDYAESVQVYYHPDQVSFKKLVEVFFATHDPTTLNRQGPDVGEQYRSIAFYRTPEEKKIIEAYIQQLGQKGAYKSKIVTHVQPFKKFWPAEDYHQDYYQLNPNDPYVVTVARPKVQKFEKQYKDILKSKYKH